MAIQGQDSIRDFILKLNTLISNFQQKIQAQDFSEGYRTQKARISQYIEESKKFKGCVDLEGLSSLDQEMEDLTGLWGSLETTPPAELLSKINEIYQKTLLIHKTLFNPKKGQLIQSKEKSEVEKIEEFLISPSHHELELILSYPKTLSIYLKSVEAFQSEEFKTPRLAKAFKNHSPKVTSRESVLMLLLFYLSRQREEIPEIFQEYDLTRLLDLLNQEDPSFIEKLIFASTDREEKLTENQATCKAFLRSVTGDKEVISIERMTNIIRFCQYMGAPSIEPTIYIRYGKLEQAEFLIQKLSQGSFDLAKAQTLKGFWLCFTRDLDEAEIFIREIQFPKAQAFVQHYYVSRAIKYTLFDKAENMTGKISNPYMQAQAQQLVAIGYLKTEITSETISSARRIASEIQSLEIKAETLLEIVSLLLADRESGSDEQLDVMKTIALSIDKHEEVVEFRDKAISLLITRCCSKGDLQSAKALIEELKDLKVRNAARKNLAIRYLELELSLKEGLDKAKSEIVEIEDAESKADAWLEAVSFLIRKNLLEEADAIVDLMDKSDELAGFREKAFFELFNAYFRKADFESAQEILKTRCHFQGGTKAYIVCLLIDDDQSDYDRRLDLIADIALSIDKNEKGGEFRDRAISLLIARFCSKGDLEPVKSLIKELKDPNERSEAQKNLAMGYLKFELFSGGIEEAKDEIVKIEDAESKADAWFQMISYLLKNDLLKEADATVDLMDKSDELASFRQKAFFELFNGYLEQADFEPAQKILETRGSFQGKTKAYAQRILAMAFLDKEITPVSILQAETLLSKIEDAMQKRAAESDMVNRLLEGGEFLKALKLARSMKKKSESTEEDNASNMDVRDRAFLYLFNACLTAKKFKTAKEIIKEIGEIQDRDQAYRILAMTYYLKERSTYERMSKRIKRARRALNQIQSPQIQAEAQLDLIRYLCQFDSTNYDDIAESIAHSMKKDAEVACFREEAFGLIFKKNYLV